MPLTAFEIPDMPETLTKARAPKITTTKFDKTTLTMYGYLQLHQTNNTIIFPSFNI